MAAGDRPSALAEPRPQAGIQQHAGIGYELVFADAPMLHFQDEDLALGAFLEQVTIQEIHEVQVPSSTVSGRLLEQEVDVSVRDIAPLDVSGEVYGTYGGCSRRSASGIESAGPTRSSTATIC